MTVEGLTFSVNIAKPQETKEFCPQTGSKKDAELIKEITSKQGRPFKVTNTKSLKDPNSHTNNLSFRQRLNPTKAIWKSTDPVNNKANLKTNIDGTIKQTYLFTNYHHMTWDQLPLDHLVIYNDTIETARVKTVKNYNIQQTSDEGIPKRVIKDNKEHCLPDKYLLNLTKVYQTTKSMDEFNQTFAKLEDGIITQQWDSKDTPLSDLTLQQSSGRFPGKTTMHENDNTTIVSQGKQTAIGGNHASFTVIIIHLTVLKLIRGKKHTAILPESNLTDLLLLGAIDTILSHTNSILTVLHNTPTAYCCLPNTTERYTAILLQDRGLQAKMLRYDNQCMILLQDPVFYEPRMTNDTDSFFQKYNACTAFRLEYFANNFNETAAQFVQATGLLPSEQSISTLNRHHISKNANSEHVSKVSHDTK
eukprot:jgi/Psemu1/18663/gm1.18663_g